MALFLPRSRLDIKQYSRMATAECARPRCTLHTSSHSETRIVESQKVAFRSPQSQRDCASKPRVARNELPWVNVQRRTQPQRGCGTVRWQDKTTRVLRPS